MDPLISECIKDLVDYVDEAIAASRATINLCDIASRVTLVFFSDELCSVHLFYGLTY